MDWTGCELVEGVPVKISGTPTVRGTRISPEMVLQYTARGASAEEILEDSPTLTADVIRSLLVSASAERIQLAS